MCNIFKREVIYMMFSVKAIYKDGKIELMEKPGDIK